MRSNVFNMSDVATPHDQRPMPTDPDGPNRNFYAASASTFGFGLSPIRWQMANTKSARFMV